MKTLWMVKHKASGTYETQPKATAKAAWDEFWFKMQRLNLHRKIAEQDYEASEVTVAETGSVCNNNEW